ncbi:MAG: hypothetical protein FWC53_04155 [Firmicutes bacterium]|nr:hypothetical protein [Bacillota bacterium]
MFKRKRLLVFFVTIVLAWFSMTIVSKAATVTSVDPNDYTANFSYFRPNDTKFNEFTTRFKNAADNYSPSFSISGLGITSSVAKDMYLEFVYMNPGYFYISDKDYATTSSTVTISYYSELTTKTAKDAFVAETDKLLATIPSTATPLEKVILVHDYIALNTMYAYDAAGNLDSHHSAYHALVDHRSTCTGFSKAFSYIMNRLGVNTLVVRGSPYVDHTWNLVKLDGNWYHIDVTHALTRDGTVNRKILGSVKHQEFLLSDNTRLLYSQWTSLTPPATSTIYENAFWQNVTTAFVPYNNQLLYFAQPKANVNDSNRTTLQELTAWDAKTGKSTVLLSFVSKWLAPGDKYYTTKVPFIGMYNNKLYYNITKEIHYFDLATGTDHVLAIEPNLTGTQQIFEMAINGSTLTYRIKEDSSVSSAVVREENIDLKNHINPVMNYKISLSRTQDSTILLNDGAAYKFSDRKVGYATSTTGITISNTGNGATGNLTIALSGKNADAFTLSKTVISSIVIGAADTFAVGFKEGLAAGTYTGVVTVSGANGIMQYFNVSLKVTN